MNKITKEEKELLIELKIKKIDNNRRYALELFKLWYDEDPKENLKEWQGFDYKQKEKLVKEIIKKEDNAIVSAAFHTNKLNVKAALSMINNLKHEQLVKMGVR